MVEERVGLFIDGGYLDHITKYGFSGKINYRKLVPYVTNNEGQLLFGYYYTCLPHQNQIQNEIEKNIYAQSRKQIAHISKVPFMSVKLGKLQRKKNVFVQKKVDVLFALDLAKSAWKDEIDTAVLIAGDSDFVPAVDEASDCGVKTVLYYYQPSYAFDLLKAVTESREITNAMYQNIIY